MALSDNFDGLFTYITFRILVLWHCLGIHPPHSEVDNTGRLHDRAKIF